LPKVWSNAKLQCHTARKWNGNKSKTENPNKKLNTENWKTTRPHQARGEKIQTKKQPQAKFSISHHLDAKNPNFV